jgi:hypothetical protein
LIEGTLLGAINRVVKRRGKAMRNIITKLVLGVAITTIAMFGADNSLGTWKRNIEKSKTSTAYKSVTMFRETSGDSVKVTNTGMREDGTTVTWSYTAKYDGKEYPVTGSGPFDTISIKQIDANTFTTVARAKGGKYHTTGRTVISKDGKTTTLTTKGTDADGKPFTQTIVSERQ